MGPPFCPAECGERVDPRLVGLLCQDCWELLTPQEHRRLFEAWQDVQDDLAGARTFLAKAQADALQIVKNRRAETAALTGDAS